MKFFDGFHSPIQTGDLAMGSISVLYERLKFIEYSDVYLIDEVGFISRIPKLKTREWLVIEPFTWPVWLMIMISFFFISIIVYLISNRMFLNGNNESSPFHLIWLKLFATLVDQRKFLFVVFYSLDIIFSKLYLFVFFLK